MSLYIYDPTATDEMSRVRGVGRYVQVLRECLSSEAIFTSNLNAIPFESTLINPFFDPLKKPLFTRRIAKKQIAVIHDLIPLKYPRHFPIGLRGKLNVFLNSLALKNYDAIVTDSHASKQDIVRLLKLRAENVYVVYPPIADIFFESHKTPDSERSDSDLRGPNYFLYVGDATWNKNLVNLAKAIQIADVNCVFVGKVFIVHPTGDQVRTPPHPWLKELDGFLNIAQGDKRFIFPGYVGDTELVGLYKNAIANILVSRDEGFGFSYFESASQSTPSLLADIPVFHETAHDAALFVNPHNPQDIAEKIQTVIKQRNILGRKAKTRLTLLSHESFRTSFLKLTNSDLRGQN